MTHSHIIKSISCGKVLFKFSEKVDDYSQMYIVMYKEAVKYWFISKKTINLREFLYNTFTY